MSEGKQVRVWDLPLRLFHWLLVAAIALAFLSSEEGSALNQWHILAGWLVVVLLVFRLVWGFAGGEHSRFSDFVRPTRVFSHLSSLIKGRAEPSLGHNPLGAVSVLLILTFAALTVWTGAFGGESAEDLHEVVAWTLLALIGLHILAVVAMSLLQRENLVRAMVVGTKSTSRHPNAHDAASAGVAAAVITAIVVAGAVFAILRYDPHAFTLRTADTMERGSDAGGQSAAQGREESD